MKKFLSVLLCALLICSMSACAEEHVHSYSSSVKQAANCGVEGILEYVCSGCGDTRTESIPVTGNHVFGAWVQASPTSMHRTCASCGVAESVPVTPATGTVDNSAHSYTSFASFAQDCTHNGSTLTYTGSSNKIAVSLTGGTATDSCENKKIIIPARVTDIQFIGLATGSPFSDFKLEFEDRVNDINVTFNDVRIEAEGTIITSFSRNIDFNIKMLGQTCSFVNLQKAADGADGVNGATNDSESVYGQDGSSGTPAFEINGNVTIQSEAALLEIQGGNGGDGGNGGHIGTSSAPSGGDGGNGGNAVRGEELVPVHVADGCTANIQGGIGGVGGEGGYSELGYFGTKRNGADGKNGANGASGCEIIGGNNVPADT